MNKICVKGQSIYFYRPPEPIPKSQVNFSKIEFDMDETWSSFLSVVAQFIQKGKPKNVKVEDGYCFVPSELEIGAFELCLRGDDGESVVASVNRLTFEVCEGFELGGVPPVPPDPDLYSKLVAKVQMEADAAKASADAANADADRAAALAADVSEKADQTAKNASDAAKAMKAAQTAQRLAETAQKAAETAKQAAETAQSAANKSATDAAGAKQDAETALKSAQDAAAAAANALESIQTLYQEMQTWAAGVIQTVNAAADSADQSATSAAGSASAASEAQSAAETAQRGAEEAKTKAEASKEASAKSEAAAKLSEQNAKASEDAAKASETASAGSASAAADSATAAQAAQSGAEASQSAAEQSAQQAAESAAVYDTVVADVNQIKQDVAAITPDDTAVDGKPWTSKKIVDSLCMPFEESGNPVQVYPVENYPLGVKVSWEPTQEGEGDPSPDNIRPIIGRDAVSVTRCEKNLLDFSSFTNYTNWRMDIATEGNAPTSSSDKGYILPVKPSKTYTISFEFLGDTFPFYLYIIKSINGVSERHAYITTDQIRQKVVSFTPEDNEIWYLRMGSIADEGAFNAKIEKITYIQLELGSAATPYEPYAGSTTEISLPETVYGGTLDVETGVVAVTWGHITSYAGEALPGEWISDRDVYATNATPTTGAQVVYKLAEPITRQISTQQIAALSGVNTLYTDADGVVVTGAEDPKRTITEMKNAIISLGGNV